MWLDKIKETAIAMLWLPIEESEFSPLIVNHPFIESGMIGYQGEMKNILEDETAKKDILMRYQAMLQNAKSLDTIFLLIRKPYRFVFLKFIEGYLDLDGFSQWLGYVWRDSENPSQDVNVSLQEAVNDDDRNDSHDSARHQNIEGVAVRRDRGAHTDRNREFLICVEHDQRPEQVVPAVHAGENGHGTECGNHIRDHNSKEYPIVRAAVNTGRFQQFLWQSQYILPEEKDHERRDQIRQDNTEIGVRQVQLDQHLVQRKQQDLERDHHQDQDQGKDRVPPLEPVHGQTIPDHGR